MPRWPARARARSRGRWSRARRSAATSRVPAAVARSTRSATAKRPDVVPLRMLGAQPEEWIAGIVEAPGSTLVVLWYEPETDLVVDIHLTGRALADAPELFARVTEQPKAGPPRRPRRVRVPDPVLAAALRGKIGDVEVVVGDISA